MVTSSTTLCLHRVLQCAKPACGCSVNAAHAQHRRLACIPEPEVKRCRWLMQQKGHTAGHLTSWNTSEVFLPGAVLRQVFSNAMLTTIVVSDIIVLSQLSTLSFIFTV